MSSSRVFYQGPVTVRQGDIEVQGSATLRRQTDKIWVDNISPPINGLTHWSGKLQADDPSVLDLHREMQIELVDGRIGRIIVTEFQIIEVTRLGDPSPRYAHASECLFVGNGPLPAVPA